MSFWVELDTALERFKIPPKITPLEAKKVWYIDKDGHIFWNISVGKKIKKHDLAGHLGKDGYIDVVYNRRSYPGHHIVWALTKRRWPEGIIDHEDRDRSNNNPKNLREVSALDNQRNLSKRSDNTSGHTGVRFDTRTNKWVAYVRIKGRLKHLGYFISRDEAIDARRAAITKYNFHPTHGEDYVQQDY